ncbi:MAG TPA: hemerythrin domain-containing protein [Bacillales bacterium]|nr:hemerythrin domain-containing protein [Bacillales bacterium]
MKSISLALNDSFKHHVSEVEDVAFELLSMEAGQEWNIQPPSHYINVIVLSGHIRFSNGNEDSERSEPHMITTNPGEKLYLKAIDTSTALFVKIPKTAAIQNEDTSLDHENAYQNPALIERVAQEIRPLVEDHIEVCKTLESFKGDSTTEVLESGLQLISNELDSHFVAEEQLLFPIMAKHVGGMEVGPVARLIEEHRIIRTLYSEVSEWFEETKQDPTDHNKEGLNKKMKALSKALLNHLGKEDSHLFPMASRLLTQEEKNSISAKLPEYMD